MRDRDISFDLTDIWSDNMSEQKAAFGSAVLRNSAVEQPEPSPSKTEFNSDVVAETLRSLDIPYMALNPGASYRGLHDSLVNHLGNQSPKMLLCLHEGHAVGIAHGYAKITGKAMAVGLHANVGLMHGTMGIFNAFCDRQPMLIMGATGSLDAPKRRPWIEWIHTARDQGALIRNFTKWDDQPSSAEAARESLLRAFWMTNTAPYAPVYINLDVELQESKLPKALEPLDPKRYMPQVETSAPAASLDKAIAMLRGAKNVVILGGRNKRDEASFNARLWLTENLKGKFISDMKAGCTFPTDHPLHAGNDKSAGAKAALKAADLIVSLDWIDLVGTFKDAFGSTKAPDVKVISITKDFEIHNGWSMDYQALPPVDLMLAGDPSIVLPELVAKMGLKGPSTYKPSERKTFTPKEGPIAPGRLSLAMTEAFAGTSITLAHSSNGFDTAAYPFRHPLDYIGGLGGGGLGGSAGATIGAALGLRQIGSDRISVAFCGDGDFSMGVTAIWTAVHYRIPTLFIISNNNSFFNDERHQKHMAQTRERNPANKWIGMRVSDPPLDFAKLAEGQGATGIGPVTAEADLVPALKKALNIVKQGGVVLIDVRTTPVDHD